VWEILERVEAVCGKTTAALSAVITVLRGYRLSSATYWPTGVGVRT